MFFIWITLATVLVLIGDAQAFNKELHIYVDGKQGNDSATGKMMAPVKTVAGAIKRLPQVIKRDVVIHLAPGNYMDTGGKGRDGERLVLNLPMHEGKGVRIVGNTIRYDKAAPPGSVVLDWPAHSSRFMIVVTQGHWSLENIQVGTRQPDQGNGISVTGTALLELHNVRIHTRGGQNGKGLHAQYGGRINLYGNIELNEDLHEGGGKEDSHCRMTAEYFGTIRFKQSQGASLSMGNGNLDARYYGVIEIRCEDARVTSWGYQSNPVAANNSGRVDFDGRTTVRICARNPKNTPIGLEQDGHMMAEGTHIIILGHGNHNAIHLQKASSFFCNDIEIQGNVRQALIASTGSMLLAGIIGDLGSVRATTCANIFIEKCTGKLIGPFKADLAGQVVLPDGKIIESGAFIQNLAPLHKAVFDGHQNKAAQLIEQGANVNSKGPNGWTPLHMAAKGGHKNTAQFLMTKGADIHAKDDQGRTPAELAEYDGHSNMAEFLRSKEQQGN